LHYPLLAPDASVNLSGGISYDQKIDRLLRYCDRTLAEFLVRVLDNPKLRNTVILVTADHGVNGRIPTTLEENVVRIPMALFGNWNRPPTRPEELRQLADVAPTVLDRLGIELPNPYIGHSLLRPVGGRAAAAFFFTPHVGLVGGVRRGDFKFWKNFDTGETHLYRPNAVHEEGIDLANDPAYHALAGDLSDLVKGVFAENNRLIDSDRVWNPAFFLRAPGDEPPPRKAGQASQR
jgi:arylsulfatase A-like enzyme